MWDISVGGSALSGESSRDAAMRETHEELGIVLNLHGMRPKFTINFEQGFDDFYLIRLDADIDNLVLQEDEVQAVKWASVNDILQMIDEGTFIPYYKSGTCLILGMATVANHNQCEILLVAVTGFRGRTFCSQKAKYRSLFTCGILTHFAASGRI